MMSTLPAPHWPDTTAAPAPSAGAHYHAAVWLLGRHPQLAHLARRAGVVEVDRDEPACTACGGPQLAVDLEQLVEAFRELDADALAWRDYRRSHAEPEDGAAWDRWQAAGPRLSETPAGRSAAAIGPMSTTEANRLRLLATLCDYGAGVPFKVDHLHGFDAAGERLILDWLEAIRAGTTNGAAAAAERRWGSFFT